MQIRIMLTCMPDSNTWMILINLLDGRTVNSIPETSVIIDSGDF